MSEKKVTDLKSENNILTRILESIRAESKSVSLSKLAVIVSTLSLFLTSFIAAGALIYVVVKNGELTEQINAVNAKANTWQEMYKETERECRLAQMEIDDFRIIIAKLGLNADHVGEKP